MRYCNFSRFSKKGLTSRNDLIPNSNLCPHICFNARLAWLLIALLLITNIFSIIYSFLKSEYIGQVFLTYFFRWKIWRIFYLLNLVVVVFFNILSHVEINAARYLCIFANFSNWISTANVSYCTNEKSRYNYKLSGRENI
jgi:uncharacterized membrane protein